MRQRLQHTEARAPHEVSLDHYEHRVGESVVQGHRPPGLHLGRDTLYTPEDLYDTAAYEDSFDFRAYSWSRLHHSPNDTLARALHDHAIDEALTAWREGRHIVGVMGGHRIRRGDADYAEAARLGRALGSSRVVATGGGPGAMEAANLGAWMAGRTDDELGEALTTLAAAPSYEPSVQAWVDAAFEVRRRYASEEPARSLAIPTWHYGHEPPNVFSDAIAKYFRNSTREAILLEVCDAGIVFLPGSAGTVQEVFQDACENYYAVDSAVAPMLLLGTEYWTKTLPVWPLLRSVASGHPMAEHLFIVDSLDEVSEIVR